MNRLNIILLTGLTLAGFTACDDAPAEATPQENQQPPIITATDVAFAPASTVESGSIDLATLTNDLQDSVALLNITKLENLADGYALVPVIEFAASDNFEKTGSVSCDVRNNVAYAAIADLNSAYATIFGYTNEAKTVYMRTIATTEYEGSDGTAVAVIGSSDNYYAPSQFTITPDLMLRLYVPMSTTGYDHTAAQALQTNDGQNYWGYVNVTGDFYFTNGREGQLQQRWDGGGQVLSGDPIGIRIDASGCVWMSYNITDGKLSTTAITTYGVIGDLPGNNWSSSAALTPNANDPLVWTGKVTFGSGEWKFRANDGWDINLGGSLTDLLPGGDNIQSPGAGEHFVTLDLSKIPYTALIQ